MPKLRYRLDDSSVNLTLPDGTVCEMQPGRIFDVPEEISVPQLDGPAKKVSYREILLKSWTPDEEGMRVAEQEQKDAREEAGKAVLGKDNVGHQAAMRKLEDAVKAFEKARDRKIPVDDPRFEEVP